MRIFASCSRRSASQRLKSIQGITIPKCYGLTAFDGRKALILDRLPGASLAEPDGPTLSYDEAKRRLKTCYDEISQLGAFQEDPTISNFILMPDKRRIMAVDLEYVAIDRTQEDIEYRNLSSMQASLEMYLGRQQFLRSDGYLDAA